MVVLEVVLDDFVEAVFRLMLDRHKAEVFGMDLTLVQAQALRLLRIEPLSTSRLAAGLGISAPAVTQLTDRLERKNLIERRNVKTDRRAVIVALTAKGGRVVDGLRSRRNEVFADTLSQLGEDDRMQVISALSKVAAVLNGREPGRRSDVPPPVNRPRRPDGGRTAVETPQASKEVGEVPVSLPTKRRMRIEWD